MTTADTHYFFGIPDWQANSGHRLKVAMLIASVLIVAALSVVRIQVAGEFVPLSELVVQLIEIAAESDSEPELEDASVAESETKPLPDTRSDIGIVQPIQVTAARRSVKSTTEISPATESPEIDDWHEFGTAIVREIIAKPKKNYTVNPPFDEKRRIAAIRFRPSDAPVKREIWENVETDQLGRTILRDGNCFRVLDDPSGVNRDIFETFEQHIIFCTITLAKAPPKELPWVNEVREQYAYLRLREEQRRDPDAF